MYLSFLLMSMSPATNSMTMKPLVKVPLPLNDPVVANNNYEDT